MSMVSSSESTFREAGTYGGVADAFGGIATVVLAIIALSGLDRPMLASVATIVFGVALLIQGGTMLTEFTGMLAPTGAAEAGENLAAGGGISGLFIVGISEIVLGVLSLIGMFPQVLTSSAVIAFGAALLMSSTSVWSLYRAKQAWYRTGAPRRVTAAEFLAGEMTAGSAIIQCVAGVAAIVLGIVALTGMNPEILSLVALLVLGATVLLTGSTLTGMVMGFMGPAARTRGEPTVRGPAE